MDIFREEPDKFDLVITDHTMPNLTGMDLAVELLKIRATIPIILCTGHSETVSPEQAKESGIKAFLMKPLTRREMAETIRRVFGCKGRRMTGFKTMVCLCLMARTDDARSTNRKVFRR